MRDIQELWFWMQRIGGILMALVVALYIIRCISGMQIISFLGFELYLNHLMKTIFMQKG